MKEKSIEALNGICDVGERGYQLRRLQEILYKGLGDRILQMRIISTLDKEWELGQNVIRGNS
jgi:hypothetical protein